MDCGYFYAPYPDLPIPVEEDMKKRHELWLRAAVELIQDRLRQNESRDGDVDTLEGVRDLIQLILEDVREEETKEKVVVTETTVPISYTSRRETDVFDESGNVVERKIEKFDEKGNLVSEVTNKQQESK